MNAAEKLQASGTPIAKAKKRRIDGFEECVVGSQFTSSIVASLADKYAKAKPYPHCVVDGLFNDDFLANVSTGR